MHAVLRFLKKSLKDALSLYLTLVKIMVPVMIVVRLAVVTGVTEWIARALAPLMGLVGLPAETGLIWTAALFVNLYAGAAAFITIAPGLSLTAAQATVLGSMMLIAHALPIEQRIAKKAGPGALPLSLFRFGGALVYGMLLSRALAAGDWLAEPAHITLALGASPNPSWGEWALGSVNALVSIFVIIVALVLGMSLLDKLGVTRRLSEALAPLLRPLGIEERAAPMTMIGLLLGIAYGGGLIIREAREGRIAPRSVFLSLALLGLCHSVFEDTLIVMALGGHPVGLLGGRVLFAWLVVWGLRYVLDAMPDRHFYRFLFRRSCRESAR